MELKINASPPYQEFSHSEIWLDDGILFCKYKPDLIMDLSHARQLLRDRTNAMDKRPLPVLTNASNLMYMNDEAWCALFQREAYHLVLAHAIVAKDTMKRILVNCAIMLDLPPVPVKVFAQESDALEWLARLATEGTISCGR